jgi:hypothetical protein
LDRENNQAPNESVSGGNEKNIEQLLTNHTEEDKSNHDNFKKEVDIGLDISTSVVGICVLESSSGSLIYLGHVKLTSYDNEYDKADNFDHSWYDASNWNVRRVFIEEAAKRFSPGFSSADTIMTLGRFNGILSYKIYQLTGKKPVMVNVKTARSKLGIKINYSDKTKSTKQKVFEAVRALNPNFSWVTRMAKTGRFKGQLVYDKVNEDRSDAWVICRGGQIMGL